MQRVTFQSVTLAIAALSLSLALQSASAQTPPGHAAAANDNHPFVGIWKLSIQKSHMRVPPGDFALYREYQDHGDGWMYHTVINVSARRVGFLFAAARYDGRQYPVYDGPLLGRFSSLGTGTPRTVEFDRISAYQFRWTDRTNGKVTGGGLCTVSADGATLTITDHIPGRAQVLEQVFDRQSAAALPDVAGVPEPGRH